MIKSISVTRAARNFAECVKCTREEGVTFVLLKDGVPVARLAPETEKTCTGRELAAALGKTYLPASESKAWYRDLKGARKRLKLPRTSARC